MQTNISQILLLFGLIATVVVMALYHALPSRQLAVAPAHGWQKQLLQAYKANEVTTSYWESMDNTHFGCKNPGPENSTLFAL